MPLIMGIINATPDSFWAPSRYALQLLDDAPDLVDVGAVSTRPGAAPVSEKEEWGRLEPVLKAVCGRVPFSVDTTRAGIVRRVFEHFGPFIVNDISAGEDDAAMLPTVAQLGLRYIAMHKRGNPRTMDALCDYGEGGVVPALVRYFEEFGRKAADAGIADWILDPGLGFAKTAAQNWEILDRLPELKALGRPVLIGAADKRFTGGHTEEAHRRALLGGADILRVHDVVAARDTINQPATAGTCCCATLSG